MVLVIFADKTVKVMNVDDDISLLNDLGEVRCFRYENGQYEELINGKWLVLKDQEPLQDFK